MFLFLAGTWDLLDVYIIPTSELYSSWMTLVIGINICFLGQMVQPYTSRYLQVCRVRKVNNYRLHPKDGGGTVFTDVCLSTLGGVTPVPGSFPDLWSHVLSGGHGTPAPGSSPGPFQGDTQSWLGGGYPSARWGIPQSWLGEYPGPR